MKEQKKGALNVGVHSFIREKTLQARLIVQQKPIKWTWNDNALSDFAIKPVLMNLDSITDWRRQQPYLVYYNDQEYMTARNWGKALQWVQWRLDRLTENLGITVDMRKSFLKNEPRITFTEVHELLKKAGVGLGDPE